MVYNMAFSYISSTEVVIRKKWKYLRDKFAIESGKQMKSRSGDAADECVVSKWAYFQQLLFLKDMVTPRVSSGSLQSLALNRSAYASTDADRNEAEDGPIHITDQDSIEQEPSSLPAELSQNEVSGDVQPEECISDSMSVSVASEIVPPSVYKRKRQSSDYQKQLLELEEKKYQYLVNKPRRSTDTDDPDLMFYKSLLCHIRKIPSETKIRFQTEIQAVVQKYAYPPVPTEGSLPHYQSYYRGSSSPCHFDGTRIMRSSSSTSSLYDYEQRTARSSSDADVYHPQ